MDKYIQDMQDRVSKEPPLDPKYKADVMGKMMKNIAGKPPLDPKIKADALDAMNKRLSGSSKTAQTQGSSISDNSTAGIISNTIKGLPDAARKVGGAIGNTLGIGGGVGSAARGALKGGAIGGVGKVLGSFKKGGKVKKTGAYKLHKGEEVKKKKKSMAHKMHVVAKGKSYQKSLEKRGSPEQFSRSEYDI